MDRAEPSPAGVGREPSLDPLNVLWHGPDADHPSDTSLVSPPLVAGSDPVSFSFNHRFAFESSTGASASTGE